MLAGALAHSPRISPTHCPLLLAGPATPLSGRLHRTHRYLHGHRVRIVDEDPACNGLLVPGIESFKGAVLMNHRSWGDFVVDPYQAHSAVIGRFAAFVAMGLAGILGMLSDRAIIIRRGKTSRQALQAMCARHLRYMVYPETTRRAAEPNADESIPLKGIGGLKNIWEARIQALIVITVNKEGIINERTGSVSFSTTLFRAREGPIDAGDYPDDFDAFRGAVQAAWDRGWARAYALRTEAEEAAARGEQQACSPAEARVAQAGSPGDGSAQLAAGLVKRRTRGAVGDKDASAKPVPEAPVVFKAWPSTRGRSQPPAAAADAGHGASHVPRT